jgi:hypothetical protein
MQFLPSSWRAWGIDANGDGRADPYNPVDAICAAARYLKAAGGANDLRRAIYAYNHANWYVDEVLLYARQYGKLPRGLLGSLTGLTQGDRFPVAAKARYADDVVERQAAKRAKPHKGVTGNVADVVTSSPTRRGINIYAHSGAKVVAVNDGTIKRIGHSKRLGRFVVLEDTYGNRFIYAGLGELAKVYPVPKPRTLTAADFKLVRPGHDAKPTSPATGGGKRSAAKAAKGSAKRSARSSSRAGNASRPRGPINTEDLRPRLHALPARAHNVARGGIAGRIDHLLRSRMPGYGSVKAYLDNVLHFDRKTMKLRRLQRGSRVTTGTVLGRIGKTSQLAPHLNFAIRPTGRGAPRIDPKPILDGWKLLEDTAIYRAAGKNPFKVQHASVTQALLASKSQLERQVLRDPRLEIYRCGRDDIRTGQIDQRVLAGMEYFADNGFRLTVTGLRCGSSRVRGKAQTALARSGYLSGSSSGNSLDIGAIDGVPVARRHGPGSLSDELIKSALKLQGVMTPEEVISQDDLPGPISISLPGYGDRVHIAFTPLSGGGYQFPFLSYTWGRTDMGVDFTGSGPINAIGNARIIQTGAAGWPNGGAGPAGQGVLYRLLDGPRAGQIIFVYEGITPTVHAGETVVAGQRIATFYPGSSIEIGFSDANGRPLAAPTYYEGKVTEWGLKMRSFLTSLGGGPNKVSRPFDQLLRPGQWKRLIGRISKIQQPRVSTEPSRYAVKTRKHGALKASKHHRASKRRKAAKHT